jgi:hypothetical protein
MAISFNNKVRGPSFKTSLGAKQSAMHKRYRDYGIARRIKKSKGQIVLRSKQYKKTHNSAVPLANFNEEH